VQPGGPGEGQRSEADASDDEPTEILRPPAAGT
jgi:hypothetical protein